MKKDEIRIAIVEDDAALGRALLETLTKAGYEAEHFQKPDEALARSNFKPFHILIVDCMLPKTHGVDLVMKMTAQGSGSEGSILMSGIFKDKNFIKEALQKTKAKTYLQKPFDLDELLLHIETMLADLIETPKAPIYELIANPSSSQRDIRKAMESVEIINGYDLPYIYGLLLDAGISGYLNLINDDGSVSGISFANGEINSVDVTDKGTFLGSILVEKGFLTASALQSVLKTTNERRIGQRLIENNLLSPHALPIALSEQMTIRLGMIIEAGLMKINFVPGQVDKQFPSIGIQMFTQFLNEWLCSKVKAEWIESFYVEWLDHSLLPGPNFALASPMAGLSVLKDFPEITKFLTSGKTLSQLINSQTYPDAKLYRALHLLIIRRVLAFNNRKQQADEDDLLARVKRLAKEMEGKNYFEMFELIGVNRKARVADITKAYREFSKIYHPDRLAGKGSPELLNLVNQVFGNMTRAYKVLTDDTAKRSYQEELEKAHVAKYLEAESIFEESKVLIKKAQFTKALEHLKKCASMVEPTTDVKLHTVWVKIKVMESGGSAQINPKQLESDMTQIPPEDRHNPTYFFVKGLLHKFLKDRDQAIRNFEHALALDPNNFDAKRELNMLKMQAKPTSGQSILNADLKDVFGRFFKKGKAS